MAKQGTIELPILSKWACIYSRKGRARFLDILKVFADGSLDTFPTGSINLDAPLMLLNPEHERANPTRPSNIAMACDLFMDATCYGFLRLIEEDIHAKRMFEPVDPLVYFIGQFDHKLAPSSVLALGYADALEQLAHGPQSFGKPKQNFERRAQP